MNKVSVATAMLLLSMLAGCAVGPNYKRPTVTLPAQLGSTGGKPETKPTAPAENGEFWRTFSDAKLSTLVEQALAKNNDLRGALARFDSSNALLRSAKLERYPIVTSSTDGGRQQVTRFQTFGFPTSSEYIRSGINASWELDFFGRVRRGIEAQRADTVASASDLASLQVAIAGEVVSAYVDLRGQQRRLRIANENTENQRRTVRLAEAKVRAGRGTNFDVLRARALLDTTLAAVPAFQTAIAVDEHRLAVLCGQTPEALVSDLDTVAADPKLPTGVDPGTPIDLLRRRPDIATAEQSLHAATARVGIATSDLFPRLRFAGAFGAAGFSAGSPFDGFSPTNLAALAIDWSFLDVGRVRARIAASRADAAGQLARYQQTVLLALEDVENALVTYGRSRERAAQLGRAVDDSRQASQLANRRYDSGATELLNLLDAQRVQLQAEDAFADNEARSGLAAVALYRALAGGWPQRLPARAAAPNVTGTR